MTSGRSTNRPARRRLLEWTAILLTVGITVSAVDLFFTWLMHAPRIAALAIDIPGETSYMRRAARDGHPVRQWRWTPIDSIAPIAACAVVRSEDGVFFNIGTLNYNSQREMLRRMLRGDFSRGGSGLSQQLARNLYLGPQRTPRRKLREYLLAWQISHTLPKTRQLEIYLNVVEWGEGVWGLGAASEHYFGIPPSRLTASRSVILAVMLPAPRRGERFAAGPRAAGKTPQVVRGLAQAMLITDLEHGATLERLSVWRAAIARGASALDAQAAADSVLGPEPVPGAPGGFDRRPLPEACNFQRRPA